MKKLLTILILSLFATHFSHAQKLAYVDTQTILEEMEEYQAAQKEIDNQSQKWQKELEEKYASIEKMYRDYQAEEVLLPDDVKQQRQETIFEEERKAKEFKKEKFGYDGELYKLQDQKIRPIQDQIYAAVEAVAKERRLDVIFDKSGNSGMLYTNALFDKTDEVRKKLGLVR